MNKTLIISPHPDDEILGCGATIAKYVNNKDEVYIAIMTNAHVGAPELYSEKNVEDIRNEARKSHKFLGVKKSFFFEFPAPNLDIFPVSKIARELNKLYNKTQPNILYIPHRGDIHNDHKVIFDSALVAARPTNNYLVKRILAYETLSETEWAAPSINDVFIPNYFERISELEIGKKIEAMSFYKSQLKEYPNSRSIEGIKSLAINRGVTINHKYAESFMLIRDIR